MEKLMITLLMALVMLTATAQTDTAKIDLLKPLPKSKNESIAQTKPVYNNAGLHLKRAGRLGVAGTMMILSGGILAAIGAVKNNKQQANVNVYGQSHITEYNYAPLLYTGLGLSSFGFLWYIPAFNELNRAGKANKWKP